jgi:hypothetical protein
MSGRLLKLVGQTKLFTRIEFLIAPPARGGRRIGQEWHNTISPPFLPERADQPFHPGGNSLCYALQWANLMGADPIYLIGFTLQSGSAYDWGYENPVTHRPSFYDVPRALDFCRFFEQQFPGRARLSSGYQGPIYDVFRKADW